jgi:hypothetical protein
VRAVEAWGIARFCALVAEEADDDMMCRSLVSIRDVWIDIANECELLADRERIARRDLVDPSDQHCESGRSRWLQPESASVTSSR